MPQLDELKEAIGRLPTASGLRADYRVVSKIVEKSLPEDADGSIPDPLWHKAYEVEMALLRLADAIQDIREDLL